MVVTLSAVGVPVAMAGRRAGARVPRGVPRSSGRVAAGAVRTCRARCSRRRVAVQCGAGQEGTNWLVGWLHSEGISDEKIDQFVSGFVAAGLGAMVVTGTFVAMGQDPFHAMKVTAFATIAALVLDELQKGPQ